ncbi:MAG: sensor histidine kinase [Streptosporangiaceae bacterium]
MSEPMPLAVIDAPERRLLPLLYVGPYVLLGVLVIVTVAEKHAAPGSLLIDLVLCALTALWTLWMFTLHPGWRVRPRPMAVFFAGYAAILLVMCARDPWFGFLTPAGYFYAFSVLRWPWRLAGVASVAVAAGTAQASGIDKHTAAGVLAYLAVVGVNVVPLGGLAWLDRRNDQQKAEREQALAKVNEANRKLETTLAENAGLHKQLVTQAREAGVLDERARMAREIHDTLAQGLTGIVTQLQAAEQAADDPAGWRRHFAAATQLARESLSEARRSVDALRPEPLEDGGRLSDALASVADKWMALHQIPVEVTTTGTARTLPPEAEVVLLRTAQEALANVGKHAQASRVGLTLSYMEHQVALDVRDDGQGFDPDISHDRPNGRRPALAEPGPPEPAAERGGFGLVAMRQRIEGLSGTLQVESEPGGGTAISATVPMAAS